MVRSRRWLWFFGLLAMLVAVSVALPLIYNLRMQLTPAQLAEAEERWRHNGPTDYDLDFVERHNDDQEGDKLLIRVRGGKVVNFLRAGEPVSEKELSASEWQAYSVPGLFRQIGEQLQEDRAAGRRNYATAFFDRKTGFPVRVCPPRPSRRTPGVERQTAAAGLTLAAALQDRLPCTLAASPHRMSPHSPSARVYLHIWHQRQTSTQRRRRCGFFCGLATGWPFNLEIRSRSSAARSKFCLAASSSISLCSASMYSSVT